MSKIAKYRQIEDYIKQEIERNHLKIGDQIMTEEQLCKRFDFSRMTINKALNHLSELGYIERIPGKGSFVTAPHVRKDTNTSTSFTEDMKSIGLVAGARLLSYEILHGKDVPYVAKKLELGEDDLIHYFVRLRTGNKTPIAISYTYIAANVIPAVNVDCLNNSFYAYLDSLDIIRYCKHMELKAYLPSEEQKKLLEINDSALLRISHVTYTDQQDRVIPFEYIETYYNGDIYTYIAQI